MLCGKATTIAKRVRAGRLSEQRGWSVTVKASQFYVWSSKGGHPAESLNVDICLLSVNACCVMDRTDREVNRTNVRG